MDDAEKKGNRKRQEAKERTERGDEKRQWKKEKYVTCIFLYLKDRVSNDDIIHAVLVVHGGVHRDLQTVEDERGQPKH